MTVHVLLSAGRGPQECAWALAHLVCRLEAEAAQRGLDVQRVKTVPGDRANTFRSVLVRIGGDAEAFAASCTATLCDAAAGRALETSRWRIHDELVRGNPTRVERPTAHGA